MQLVKRPVEWKRRLSTTMPHTLAFLYFLILFLPWSHQKMRAERDQYVTKLCDVRKNGFTCSKDVSSTKARSKDAAARWTIMLLHTKSRATALASIWGSSRNAPSNVLQTWHGLSILSGAYLDPGDMNAKEVNGHRFRTSFPTVENDTIDYRTDAAESRKIAPLYARRRSNAD